MMCQNRELLSYQEKEINKLWRTIYILIAIIILLILTNIVINICGIKKIKEYIYDYEEETYTYYEIQSEDGNAVFNYANNGGEINYENADKLGESSNSEDNSYHSQKEEKTKTISEE